MLNQDSNIQSGSVGGQLGCGLYHKSAEAEKEERERGLRHTALAFASNLGGDPLQVVERAKAYYEFLKG
jgi:hypothetical protein